MSKSDLTLLPGVGKTLQKDFARIGLVSIADFKGKNAEVLFEQLRAANAREKHATSKNYLYVLRYVVYCASTSPAKRRPELMKWSAWKD
jgi:Pathogenicity locus